MNLIYWNSCSCMVTSKIWSQMLMQLHRGLLDCLLCGCQLSDCQDIQATQWPICKGVEANSQCQLANPERITLSKFSNPSYAFRRLSEFQQEWLQPLESFSEKCLAEPIPNCLILRFYEYNKVWGESDMQH